MIKKIISGDFNQNLLIQEMFGATSVTCKILGGENGDSNIYIEVELEDTPENNIFVDGVLAQHSGSPCQECDIKTQEIREQRNIMLNGVDVLLHRHLDEKDLIILGDISETTWNNGEYQSVIRYKQALRDMFDEGFDPDNFTWPTVPECLQ